MKFISVTTVVAAIAGVAMISGSALAVTKAKSQGFHCVSTKGIELKTAAKASDCKAPYRWVKIGPTTAAVSKPKVRNLSTSKKRKSQISTLDKRATRQ